jgi:phage-related protein
MEMKEFASKLGIDIEGTLEGEKYVIELANSNEYSRVYTLLDKSELVNIDEDSTLVTENVGELLFLGDEFDIKLVGNFAQDIYRIVITVGE